MKTLRSLILLVPLTVAVASYAHADALPAPPADATSPGHHHRGHGGMRALLRQLDLSADQKTQLQSIRAQAKPQSDALRAARRTNRRALATPPPSDPAYAGLLSAAKSDAASAIQMRSDMWTQVYAVLTPGQRAMIPGLVAQAEQRRVARRAERAGHVSGPV